MRAVVQRVTSAGMDTDAISRRIGPGLAVLVGIEVGDTERDLEWMAGKVTQLRIFEDEAGKMNKSVVEIGGSVLLVPNFTLAGDARQGRRPSFDTAMPPNQAGPMFDRLAELVRAAGVAVETGVFRAHMKITLCNDGPVTIWLDSRG